MSVRRIPFLLLVVVVSRIGTAGAAGPDTGAIESLLERGWKEGKFPSVAAGIIRREGIVFSHVLGIADRKSGRRATPATLYRIGSVTKVFTAALLAVLRDSGTVRLDDSVSAYLPPAVRLPTDPRGAPAITLRHLATHASGLPRAPVNLKHKGQDFYGGYRVEDLHAGLSVTRLDSPPGSAYGYSNLGAGLLGHALERAAGVPYEELLQKRILGPLGMERTSISPGSDWPDLLAAGYEADDPEKEAVLWDLGCLAPAGGLVSSVEDLSRFIALQLRAGEAGVEPIAGGTLLELQTPQRLAEGWSLAMGLGWHVEPFDGPGDRVWHDGNVAGFRSYVALAPRLGVGVILLANSSKDLGTLGRSFLDQAAAAFGVEKPREIDPALQKVAGAISAFFTKDPPRRALVDLFHEQFLAEVPLEKLVALFQDVHLKNGACDGFEVTPGKMPQRAKVLFSFPGGKSARCDIEIEGGPGAKIVYFFIRL